MSFYKKKKRKKKDGCLPNGINVGVVFFLLQIVSHFTAHLIILNTNA